ncbi:unnamed protein product [Allacma fusca]|uniref:Uncharacterized protein n=1 Tax=Allacma fusca TaxID=39272 RepID=A0A8J2K4C6_9HEXA|nr:unnamed protein product [Allacma fusca]
MAKINTRSRLELAHLKRQLETRRKPTKSFREEVQSQAAPTNQKQGENKNENTRFDYKFVFTNNAIKTDDRILRTRNRTAAFEKDMKMLKPLVPTNSFLPYGVSIRNPHMFEEDQLAVIQRRQEVQNITFPATPYNPFAAGRRNVNKMRPGTSIPKKVEFSTPRNPIHNRPGLDSSDGRSKLLMNPLGNHRNIRTATEAVAKTNKSILQRGDAFLNSTQARDSEFRQQFDALESHRAIKTDKEDDSAGAMSTQDRVARNKDVIDKLSSTVQQLNQYEDRLKLYLKSKNTMTHAGAALKQLRTKRSKTIAQLTKLSQLQESTGKRDSKDETKSEKRPTLPHDEKLKQIANENNNFPKTSTDSRGFPHILHGYTQELRKTKSPLDGERLASVIGKKILSIRGLASTSKNDDDARMTPLQAAMMEGIDLNQMSALIGHSDSEKDEESPEQAGTSVKIQSIAKSPAEKPIQGSSSKPTVSLYRYHRNPMSLLDGETLLEPPKFSSAGDDRFRLFATAPPPNNDEGASVEIRKESDVLRRVYEEFQIHEEKVQRELLRDQNRRDRPKIIDPSIRRIAEFSNFMQKKALNQSRPSQQVHH